MARGQDCNDSTTIPVRTDWQSSSTTAQYFANFSSKGRAITWSAKFSQASNLKL